MLGSSCSSCCGWRCYYTDDSDGPTGPTNFRFIDFVCDPSDPTRVAAKLKFDLTPEGECVPLMYCQIQVTDANLETPQWNDAFIEGAVDSGTADTLTRADGLLGVDIRCQYATLFPPSAQIAYYRSNGSNLTRQVRFRIRSRAASGPHNGEYSSWVYGSFTCVDPRSVSFNTGATFNRGTVPVPNYWQFSVAVSGCGIQTNGRFDVNQAVAYRTLPASPSWSPLLLASSSWVATEDYSINLAPASGVVAGYGLGDNPYGNANPEDSSTIGRCWLMANHRDATEVMAISNINGTSVGSS